MQKKQVAAILNEIGTILEIQGENMFKVRAYYNAARTIDFKVSDGVKTYPVTYHGLVPDTFTDANDIEVVVEGRLGRDGVIRATDVLAKCGSRYEAVPKA